ncbi:TetR/AcrR family transcriptional regulator [Novosphingobium sp. AP12]|uniref:TetR/AcrR family transcriptional regulator n=1 Tax=Novosphingobium sp. AP12 TaxID=1144305 RepID=UPI000271EC0A|nr:TetR/AcrR family transcriptional regulator [Novosphingobium sp. AP12]EJL34398.1 transcriptional regulator [Novosphingobium sp. AP12]
MTALKAKRIRRTPETMRKLILDMTERLMLDEGYAAVSTRRVAQELNINGATVHYYFATTDDLFAALHRRMTSDHLEGLKAVLGSSSPLEALWTYQAETDQSALGIEFFALSNHRKTMRPVLAAVANEARQAQAEALAPVIASLGLDSKLLPPVALATMVVAITRTLKNEERVGITCGHEEVRAFCEHLLRNLPAADHR